MCFFPAEFSLCVCAFVPCFCIHWEVESSSGVSCTGTSKGPSTGCELQAHLRRDALQFEAIRK